MTRRLDRVAGPSASDASKSSKLVYIVHYELFIVSSLPLARHLQKKPIDSGSLASKPVVVRRKNKDMNKLRILLMVGMSAVSLVSPRIVLGQTTTPPPTVVPQDRDDRDLLRDLKGVPDNVKTLILSFDQQRDQFLRQQRLLLIKLRHATTAEEREQIREQLQANRQEFLADLKSFRQELRADLQKLKGEISHAEFLRIIDAAHDAAKDGGHRHRGQ